VALELGIPCRVEDDGLLLDDPELGAVVDRAIALPAPPLLALRQAAASTGLDPARTSALMAWAVEYHDLAAFRDALVARIGLRDRLLTEQDALTLATVHGTKGLEWDHVACIGHDEGAFPSGRAISGSSEPERVLEEERRLAYVAWTRARQTLTIVYDPGAPSVFLREAFDAAELD
jgi:superfamily I DNA/RNA helicase